MYSRGTGSGLRQAGGAERRALPPRQLADIEAGDQLVEEAMPVDLGLEVEEHRAEADRRAVHEDELARRRDAAEAPQLGMHLLDDLAAVLPLPGLLDLAPTVVEQ